MPVPHDLLKRVNIQLPYELKEKIEVYATRSGVSVSEFFRRSAIERINQLEREELDRKLAEAYKDSAEDNRSLAAEWEVVDLEGWDSQ